MIAGADFSRVQTMALLHNKYLLNCVEQFASLQYHYSTQHNIIITIIVLF